MKCGGISSNKKCLKNRKKRTETARVDDNFSQVLYNYYIPNFFFYITPLKIYFKKND
jgi:hypothetical protein